MGFDWVVNTTVNTATAHTSDFYEPTSLMPMPFKRDDAEEFMERMDALQSEYQVIGSKKKLNARGVYHDQWVVVLSSKSLE